MNRLELQYRASGKPGADFEAAVDKLVEAGITPFGLNAGWPTNILTAAYLQRSEESRAFYAEGKEVESMDTVAFQDTLSFIQKNPAEDWRSKLWPWRR